MVSNDRSPYAFVRDIEAAASVVGPSWRGEVCWACRAEFPLEFKVTTESNSIPPLTKHVLALGLAVAGTLDPAYGEANREWWRCVSEFQGKPFQTVFYAWDYNQRGMYEYWAYDKSLIYAGGWTLSDDVFSDAGGSNTINRKTGGYKQSGFLGGVSYGKCERTAAQSISGGVRGAPWTDPDTGHRY